MALDPFAKGPRKLREGINAYQLRQLHKEKKDLREAHFALWQATVNETGTGRPVDAIVCPVAPFAAPPHGQNKSDIASSRFSVRDVINSY